MHVCIYPHIREYTLKKAKIHSGGLAGTKRGFGRSPESIMQLEVKANIARGLRMFTNFTTDINIALMIYNVVLVDV